jgi:hypothetical protein
MHSRPRARCQLAYASIFYDAPLWVTALLWSMVWFLPFAARVLFYVCGWMNEKNAVRDLHRYVIHRLGDGAIIVLGEGVLQVIRWVLLGRLAVQARACASEREKANSARRRRRIEARTGPPLRRITLR